MEQQQTEQGTSRVCDINSSVSSWVNNSKVVLLPPGVVPSKTNAPVISIVVEFTVVVVPLTIKLPAIVVSESVTVSLATLLV